MIGELQGVQRGGQSNVPHEETLALCNDGWEQRDGSHIRRTEQWFWLERCGCVGTMMVFSLPEQCA